MKNLKKPKVPRINIPKTDRNNFNINDLQIDPYWLDLYELLSR